MTTWADEYITQLDDSEKRQDRLTDWEVNFIDSLRRQLEAGRRLTANQVEKLDDIWERATARG